MQESYLSALDEFFCSRYCDYTKICAIPGYKAPNLIVVAKNGGIERKDSEVMKLCHQPNKEEVLASFKRGLADVDFSFQIRYPTRRERVKGFFSSKTFARKLPKILEKYNETPKGLGEKLAIEGDIWERVIKGKLYPEKNLILAIALVCGMQTEDVSELFATYGMGLSPDNVRDVVVEYLIRQKLFNPVMRDACLKEYSIFCIPVKAGV